MKVNLFEGKIKGAKKVKLQIKNLSIKNSKKGDKLCDIYIGSQLICVHQEMIQIEYVTI